MMKKIIGLTLTLVMVLSLVQLPASAAVTNIFSATIEGRSQTNATYTVSSVINTNEYFYSDDTTTGKGAVKRKKDVTVLSEAERSADTSALKFVSNGEAEDLVQVGLEYVPDQSYGYAIADSDMLHISIDFKTEDMNCDKILRLRTQAADYWNFLKFTTDGKITFFDNFVDTYTLNEWYEIDAYYSDSDAFWYVFVNDQLAKVYKKYITANYLRILGAKWTAPVGVTTTVYLDDIVANITTKDDLKAQLPAYYASFDNNTVGSVSGTSATNDVTHSSINALSKSTGTNVSIYLKDENNGGDNAIKFESSTNTSETVVADHFHGEAEQPVGDSDIFHFGVDCKFDDRNLEKTVMLRSYNGAVNDDAFDFMKFKTDGTVTLWGKTVALWNTNTWYEIDVYNDKANNLWYLYVNDEFCATVSKTLTYDKVSLVRIRWVLASDVGSTTHIDNFTFGVVSPSYLNALLPQTPADNSLIAVRNPVDTNSILINAAGPEIAGTLVAALYDGTELAEVKTVDAANAAYVTFTKAGDNAKIMWWNGTEDDVTPKTAAVPVSFSAAN